MQYNSSNLSTYALDILGKIENKDFIKYVNETKTWDGIDEYGPEIIIHTLYLIIDKSTFSGGIHMYEYFTYNIEYYTSENLDNIKYNLQKKEYHNVLNTDRFYS
jgi:hypothetical protein